MREPRSDAPTYCRKAIPKPPVKPPSSAPRISPASTNAPAFRSMGCEPQSMQLGPKPRYVFKRVIPAAPSTAKYRLAMSDGERACSTADPCHIVMPVVVSLVSHELLPPLVRHQRMFSCVGF